MPNKNYLKGRRKEYRIRKELLEQGWTIVQRSASSKSCIDLWCVHKDTRRILLVQCKPDNFPVKEAECLKRELNWLNGTFLVEFQLL